MPDKNYTPPQSQLEQSFYNFLNRGDWRDNYRTVASDLSSQMQDTQSNFDSSINLGFDYSDAALWDRAHQNWRINEATKRAKERLEKERIPSVATSPYDVTKGWRESTEDSAKLDKYILEELGYSPEEAQNAYDEIWSNSRKALGVGSAAALGIPVLMGISGGAAGPVAADVINSLFAADAVKNLASNNGIQKTYKLARQGDTWGAIKSGAWDALDLSMLGHTAGIARRVGKSMLNGSTFGNAYRSDIAGRMLNSQIKAPKITPAQQNILAGKIGWGPKTTEILYHHSNEPLSELDPMFKSWDVIERGAPRGKVWLTEDSGTAGFLAERPYHQTAEVTLTKPMVQIGEAIGNGKNAVRNDIVRFAQDAGADGIQFKGIADNQLTNQNITASFKPEKLIIPGKRK